MAGVVQVLARAKPHLAWRRLAAYLRRLGYRSLCLRCGFLAELVRPSVPVPSGWRASFIARPADAWVLLGPPGTYGRHGPRDRTWHVIRNVPERELLAEADAR